MKILVISSLLVFNFFSSSSLDYQPKLEKENLALCPTPDAVICLEETYQIKSESAIASMNPRQLIDELVRVVPASFDTLSQVYNYQDLIENRVRKAGVNSLSIFTKYMNAYEPQNASKCEAGRFDQLLRLAHDIDRFEFRLRGTTEGRLTIDAIERAIERKEKTGIKIRKEDRTLFLNDLKGVNEVDRAIQETFWVNKKIEISDSELLEFSNFLSARDHKYPTWSETDFIKDHTKINKAGNPLQVYIFKNPEPFYEAYSEFKKTKRD